MARGPIPVEESEFEKQRLANIAERDALLKELTKEAHQAGLFTKAAVNGAKPAKKKTPAKKVKSEEDSVPRRTSSRLAGIQADSEVAKRKADEEYEAAKEADRIKRLRRTDDLALGDIVVNGKLVGDSLLGTDTILKGLARPYERTFSEEEVRDTTDKELKTLREKMSGLGLWGGWEPNRIKLTPERIYSMSFHPTATKPVVFAGDKLGHLGIIDAAQNAPSVKREDDNTDEEGEDPDPVITTIKPHTRTISAMHTHVSRPQTLYTASYDSSIRSIDLIKNIAVEIYGPSNQEEDEPVSGIDMADSDPNVTYFTTLNGSFGRHDSREPNLATELFQLSEKKIGGFSLNPLVPHYLATASLDRMMKLWDLRKITKKLPTLVGEHESRLSVSHAAFNTAGQVATSSYDDSIKIYSFGVGSVDGTGTMNHWKAGFQLDEAKMRPEVVVRHNCQTGRWVTILRPQWQRHPQDHIQKLCIGNMNRFVDVYSANGTQLAQLGGEGITAVPAVAVFHPTNDWIAGGTASGKLCLWM